MKMLNVRSVWIDREIRLFVHVIILSLVMNVHVYCIVEEIHVLFAVNVLMMLFVFIRKNRSILFSNERIPFFCVVSLYTRVYFVS